MTQLFLEASANEPSLQGVRKLIRTWHRVQFELSPGKEHRHWSLEEKLAFLRSEKLGRFTLIPVPDFWQDIHPGIRGSHYKTLVHLDYTASAQGLRFIEDYMIDCLRTYANTHTETSATGKNSTIRFHQGIEYIRRHVNGGQDSFVIPCGYGATGAVERIQKILGLYLSPKGQKTLNETLGCDVKKELAKKFVVFVGPTEHHSNDVTWQDASLCHFVRIKAISDGPSVNKVDLDDLENQLKKYPDHIKVGSFSAASNVTGMSFDLKIIGDILKRHQAMFFVDYAASGPYADINMERDGIDALYLSMHKNLGGSNLGFLVGKNHIYDTSTNPSFGGGGTVTAVTPWEYYFHERIEDREYPGTPAIRQVWQAALSFQLKDWVGVDQIQTIDLDYTTRMLDFMGEHPKIQILGNPDPKLRYPIFSFLVKHGDRMLHHTFVAALLNDVFGIQARSGCACAGPFGHELLKIPKELSDKYVQMILNVLNGFKPGWTRIGMHYTLSEEEVRYVFRALNGVAFFGPLFMDHYSFDPYTGEWLHDRVADSEPQLRLEDALTYRDDSSQLPRLNDENGLMMAFEQQWQEFLLMTSGKIANIVIDRGEHLSRGADFDRLTTETLPILKDFLEDFGKESYEFSVDLAKALCPLITPPGKNPEECQKTIIDTLDQLIFIPEKNLHRYEDFSEVDPGVDFFYVPKGKTHPKINLARLEEETPCLPCTPR
ncbi:aminotransferase class V-fold PLP-dependent enzyme [Pseudobacteriovorax antillogorgiicola]|uniref:Selenocysteine lyase/Cysteine desulfurase n=1 Tax=Pseudobacteriovorax antillogorgiicola TaxID=1513793 RepID=A0A1Y6CJV3_9BACT|nr:aminotransferase class V-fold PLP-dependent enzyme [Pseudobacteriovorax antillogorgiicola]TCS48349.1 selenocysteine lyase/cysteine desulfurase [Pseudobacteriovorax antillogorgiicola]SMF56291.1 Selenocysteine lyase/Cysteine desulfurase [Pseudobacteriovorax antillogorgiicola]